MAGEIELAPPLLLWPNIPKINDEREVPSVFAGGMDGPWSASTAAMTERTPLLAAAASPRVLTSAVIAAAPSSHA